MKKIAHILLLTAVSLAVALPIIASAQTLPDPAASSTAPQFASNGIYGCNKTGAAASSVAAFSASGAYVPVSDAAVELNTGYLVYLACSLRPLVSALSQSATAGLVDKITKSFTQGNNGNPQFSQNINNEQTQLLLNSAQQTIPIIANAVSPNFKSAIQSSIAQSAMANINNPTGALACPYTSTQINANVWTGVASIGVPTCDVLITDGLAYDQMSAAGANSVSNYMTEAGWGSGALPITTTDANGNVNVVTPGAVVLNQAEQALQAGFTKTENANDIGQMVTSLFAGIGAQALSSAQGLVGLTQSSNGSPSYLDQVAAAASQNVATNAINTAITVLNGVLTTVTNYLNSLNAIGNTLKSVIDTLRGDEADCWTNIINKVCVGGAVSYSTGKPTCIEAHLSGTATSTSPVTLHVATSTPYDFAQTVINTDIASLATQTVSNINSVQSMINEINTLIAGVTNTTSQAAQNAALQQLDQLTASNSFPSPTDIANAQQQATSISSTMNTLLSTVTANWTGTNGSATDAYGNPIPEPWDGTVTANTVGWCDTNDAGTLLAWESLWKK
jgi:hypothetical protein